MTVFIIARNKKQDPKGVRITGTRGKPSVYHTLPDCRKIGGNHLEDRPVRGITEETARLRGLRKCGTCPGHPHV